jgi:hypothetical protein
VLHQTRLSWETRTRSCLVAQDQWKNAWMTVAGKRNNRPACESFSHTQHTPSITPYATRHQITARFDRMATHAKRLQIRRIEDSPARNDRRHMVNQFGLSHKAN